MKNTKDINQLKFLTELIRMANSHIRHFSDDDLERILNNKNSVFSLYKKYPSCVLTVKDLKGNILPLFPICDVYGIKCLKAIKISQVIVRKLIADENSNFDINDLQLILNRLSRLEKTYSKTPIRPKHMAIKKGMLTRMLKNIEFFLKDVRKKD